MPSRIIIKSAPKKLRIPSVRSAGAERTRSIRNSRSEHSTRLSVAFQTWKNGDSDGGISAADRIPSLTLLEACAGGSNERVAGMAPEFSRQSVFLQIASTSFRLIKDE